MNAPDLSVVVPAFRASALLADTLPALLASHFPRDRWELIVVDDAGGDDTATTAARWADRVIVLDGPPGGPGRGRNAGAHVAQGRWLVFVDQDVRVHRDTLSRIAHVAAEQPDLVAMFGTYDAFPAERGLLSEYRNLLHRQIHCGGAGDAETFWAGCGAVRRDAFEAVHGFDTVRFPRGQIEDIELGYRLREHGGRILLDPGIQATHLKRWTFAVMVRTDIRDRGIPWMRLLLERGNRDAATLNTGRAEKAKVALAAMIPLVLIGAILGKSSAAALTALGLLVALLLSNAGTYAWFARERNWAFALRVVPLNLLYYFGNAIAATIGVWQHLVTMASSGRRSVPHGGVNV